MNKKLVKELCNAFGNARSQKELDKLREKIIEKINLYYMFSSNRLREKNKYSQIIIDEVNFFKSLYLKKE